MRRIFLASFALGLSLLAPGCKHEPPITNAVIEVSDWKSLALPIEILVDGTSVGTFSDRSFTFDIPPGTTNVVARAGFPCQVKEIKVPLHPPTDQQLAEDKQANHDPAKRGSVNVFANEVMAKFWVDNREGAAAHVKMGQLEFDLPADSSPVLEVPAPLCEDIYVRVNGNDLGAWPKAPANADPPPANPNSGRMGATASNNAALNLLLDVGGYHCYNFKKVLYSDRRQFFFNASEDPGKTLSGQRLYALTSQLDFFLTPAPKTVQGFANAVRAQLIDTGCSR